VTKKLSGRRSFGGLSEIYQKGPHKVNMAQTLRLSIALTADASEFEYIDGREGIEPARIKLASSLCVLAS
jgi:hypothetical protein